MTLTFRWKLFLTFAIYGIFVVFVTQLILYNINVSKIQTNNLDKASEIFKKKNQYLQVHVKDANNKLSAILSSNNFKRYLYNTEELELANSLFVDIANSTDTIMQLRYIDKDGYEKIRINKATPSTKAYVIDTEELQNKSNRYYFSQTLSTPKDIFWYSKIDLNMEHNKIEKPIQPVFRVGTAVFKDGKVAGVLIVNIFMKKILQKLTYSPLNDIYLFDKDGHIIVSTQDNQSWSRYLNKEYTIDLLFPKYENNLDSNTYTKEITLNNEENIHILINPKMNYIEDELYQNLKQFLFIMIGVIFFSIPFSYFFSKIPSKLKQTIQRQEEEQNILLSLFDTSDAVLLKWNNPNKFTISYASKSILELTGYSQEEFIKHKVGYLECVVKEDMQQIKDEVSSAIQNSLEFFKHKPYRIIAKDESVKWILATTIVVKDKKTRATSFISYLNNISDIKKSEEKFKKLSITDQLTKIYNRVHLDNVLQNQKYRFERDREIFSVILVDIDFFKSVNDNYGHLVGDLTLVEFAQLLSMYLRESDILGRWGGEEFLIILPHTNLPRAILLAKKLREMVEKKNFTTINHLTASFGVASFERDMSIEDVVDSADNALYRSKNNGRNCVSTVQTQKES